jgi:acyl-CoA reductase-like NAD-dependent aldehyde dehydrogenase
VFGRRTSVDERFGRILTQVEAAKEDLVASVPSPRGVPVRPVADALSAFEDGLRRAADELARWRTAEVGLRQSCRAAVEEALRRAERVRLDAPPLDYESLVAVIGDLMAPLEEFERVEARLRRRG